jgi:ubiquinone/menaquinone biosynthesis C-methylase UbiE
MGTPWDRPAAVYVEQWMPRFIPYHADLIRELTLRPGNRVLITSSGPGAEVLGVARAVGTSGAVRATDKSSSMVSYCAEQVRKAGFGTAISCEEADASNTAGGPWDAIFCSFGMWQYDDRNRILRAWRDALEPLGKVGVMTWGPPEPEDPYEILSSALRAVAPETRSPETRIHAERSAMAKMYEDVGLEMVRHTIVRHTISFRTNEDFIKAIREGCTWRRVSEELTDEAFQRIMVRFYDALGGPDAPLTYSAPATIAIACLPGARVDLEARPSLRPPGPPSM